MSFKILTRHRFNNSEPEKMVEVISVTNGEIAQKIVDKLKRQRFTDENGRSRYRYGQRGVKLVSQD